MKILTYNELSPRKAKAQFDHIRQLLERGDFTAAEVKKLSGTPYYRAKLGDADRLLFTIMKHGDERCILLLEIIYNHEYQKSRFLNGAAIDEAKIDPVKTPQEIDHASLPEMVFRNSKSTVFHLLDKVISFDDMQQEIFQLRPPVIVIGSAGSGKTVLTLEKLKQLAGNILYVTRSPFLADNSRKLYNANGYANDKQEVEFLSFVEFLSGIRVPAGRELTFREFSRWFDRHRQAARLKDAHALFEEFNGVITGMSHEREYLSREDYLALGIKQSIFTGVEREEAYSLFVKHLELMKENDFYNLNMAAFHRLPLCRSLYDFAVIDEIQDLTNVQLALILKTLKSPHDFVLCGDSNQIVHPNFFSWSKVKSMFYLRHLQQGGSEKEIIRILHSNYRNSRAVTVAANRLLRIKNARFGSIDRESNYLVECNSSRPGQVELLADQAKTNQELNEKTAGSARYAVLVMREEQKNDARRFFKTPLVFSVQEAKGLEYENIILYNFIAPNNAIFDEIVAGVTSADLDGDLNYARAKDKSDKSLEMFKFHINSLYVAVTRAIDRLYVIDGRPGHALFQLLGLEAQNVPLKLEKQSSSKSEWQEEARKLELQGKKEQAAAIRRDILKNETVPWTVYDRDALPELLRNAFDLNNFNKKAKQHLFDYAFCYNLPRLKEKLVTHKFNLAARADDAQSYYRHTYYLKYQPTQAKVLWKEIDRHGIDFRNPLNQTPLMLSCRSGNAALAAELLNQGADPLSADNTGRMPFHHFWQYAVGKKNFEMGQWAEVYRRLEPAAINVKVGDRLVKLDNRLMEFFHFNLLFAVISEWPNYKVDKIFHNRFYPGEPVDFIAADIEHAAGMLPDFIMPEYRKKRQYVSSILSKNELTREGDYNRELFLRIRTGHYLVNPQLELNVNDQWINFYDLLHFSYYAEKSNHPAHWPVYVIWLRYLREHEAGTRKFNFDQIASDVVIYLTRKHYEANPNRGWRRDILDNHWRQWQASPAHTVVEQYLNELD